MTYDYFCEHVKELMSEAARYNWWRKRAKRKLLLDIAPRIGVLADKFYMGCGFHYYLEQQLGKLINSLALPVQWSANWRDKINDDRLRVLSLQVGVMLLCQSVVNAEKSIKSS